MKRLPSPAFGALDLFDACVDEMTPLVREPFAESRSDIQSAADVFSALSVAGEWCNLPRARHGHREDVIAGKLTKGDLMNLYDEYVVRSKGQPRDIYDKILIASLGACPYCAGVGESRTLDHYLPKAKFPSFSVHPQNLVPACRDCNTDAGAGFPMAPAEQVIHPYLDRDHFFVERWIYADVVRCDPIVVRFFVSVPGHWSEVDKLRAERHFIDCRLGKRFSKQVAVEIGPLIRQRKSTLSVFSPRQFQDHLRVVADDADLLLNGWKRTMYLGLCESDWFCAEDFRGWAD